MKRFLKTYLLCLIVFVVCLFVYDQVNLFVFNKVHAVDIEKMGRLFSGRQTENVAIFGSSRALRHYIPDMLSESAYNYGISASRMNETVYLVKKRLENFKKGIIIINLDPTGFPSDMRVATMPPFQGEYRFVAFRNRNAADIPAGVVGFKDAAIGFRFWGLLRRHLTELWSSQNLHFVHCSGAELDDGIVTEDSWEKLESSVSNFKFDIKEDVQPILDGLYDMASGDVLFVWVVAPVAGCYDGKLSGLHDLQEFLNEQSRHKNVRCYSFLDVGKTFDWTEFADPYHLNIKGARHFTDLLRNELLKCPEFLDIMTGLPNSFQND